MTRMTENLQTHLYWFSLVDNKIISMLFCAKVLSSPSVCLCVCFRHTADVLQERYASHHPESVCHHHCILVTSPVDHMEES